MIAWIRLNKLTNQNNSITIFLTKNWILWLSHETKKTCLKIDIIFIVFQIFLITLISFVQKKLIFSNLLSFQYIIFFVIRKIKFSIVWKKNDIFFESKWNEMYSNIWTIKTYMRFWLTLKISSIMKFKLLLLFVIEWTWRCFFS